MNVFQSGKITLIHGDCMEYLSGLSDKAFDLAVVDPPYGMARKMDGSGGGRKGDAQVEKRGVLGYCSRPRLLQELDRASEKCIVWGANNFIEHLEKTTNFIFWHKHQPAPNFADGELAWTNFSGPCKCYDAPCFGAHGKM